MADQEPPIKVTGLPRWRISQDHSEVELDFDGEKNDAPTVLRLSAKAFMKAIVGLNSIAAHIRRTQAASALQQIYAETVSGAEAIAPFGRGRVVVGIRTDSGILYQFSFSPDQASELCDRLQSAEQKARKEALSSH